MKKTALVLQGGGALGAYQYGAIKYFYEKDPDFDPCIVTGVSIGSVNAAVMLGGKYGPVKSLEKLWNTIKIPPLPFIPQEWQAKISKIGNPNMYYINPILMYSPLTADSVYDITPFRNLLADIIDFDKLNNHSAALVVESVNVETGQLERFSNKDADGIDLDKVVSSMSIPPNFPAVEIENGFYWDGGLYANMPLSPAINFLESIKEENGEKVTEREVIVISLFRKNAILPNDISEITERIKELMFESKLNLDRKFFDKMNSYIELIKEVNKELPDGSPIRDNKAFQELLGHEKINPPILLQYEAEGVAGTDDFTPEQMDFRVRQGYRDAAQAVKLNNPALPI